MTATPTLSRSLNLTQVTLYGLGNILGAGVYVLIGKVAGEAGYLAPFSFLIASIIAGITAFSFCELSSRYPVSAGEAVYVQKGFNIPQLSLWIGLLVILTGIVSAATITKGFSGYLGVFINLPDKLVIISLLFLLCAVAISGVAESVSIAAFITILEISGLLLIIYVTVPAMEQLPKRASEFIPSFELSSWTGVFGGSFLAFYAYVGFEDMVNLAEEVKTPRRTLPLAIITALGVATCIYLILAVNSLLILSPEQLQASEAPLADIYHTVTNKNPWFISIVSLFAVVNGALIQIIMGSRVCYGMAKQGLVSAVLGQVNSRTQTPVLATVVITAIIIGTALWLPIETLAKTTTYFLLILFCLINLSLVRIKQLEETPDHVFAVPSIVPITGFTASLLFLGMQTWSLLSNLWPV
ncbi:MAG: amino acid transporter [Pseudohongiellaceae bacterium]|jgi:amino acid transporter